MANSRLRTGPPRSLGKCFRWRVGRDPAPQSGKTLRRSGGADQSPVHQVSAWATGIRGHRGIENSLHWVLDVALREDDCRARTGHADTRKHCIRTKQKIAAWDHRHLVKLLSI